MVNFSHLSFNEMLHYFFVWCISLRLNIRSSDLFKTNFWDAASKFFFPLILISQSNSSTLCSLPRLCTCTVFSTLSSSLSKSEIFKTGVVSLQDLSLKPKIKETKNQRNHQQIFLNIVWSVAVFPLVFFTALR